MQTGNALAIRPGIYIFKTAVGNEVAGRRNATGVAYKNVDISNIALTPEERQVLCPFPILIRFRDVCGPLIPKFISPHRLYRPLRAVPQYAQAGWPG